MKILTKTAALLSIALLISSPLNNALAKKNNVRTEIDTISALQIIIFDTAQGKIIVSLPEEILAGDMISGTIRKEPKGKNQKDLESNNNKLSKYSVEINNETRVVSENELKFSIPKSSTGGVTYMILRDANGEEWARNYITYQNSSIDIQNFETPSPWEYQSPKIGRSTNPSVIKGPFDGNFGTTSIMVGSSTVKKIAESPRVLVFQNPSSPIGNIDLILNERGINVKRKYSNIQVVKLDEDNNEIKSVDEADSTKAIAKQDQNEKIDKPAESKNDTELQSDKITYNTETIKTAKKETVSENKYGMLKEAEIPLEINGKEKTVEKAETKLAKNTASEQSDKKSDVMNKDINSNAEKFSEKSSGKYTVQIASYKAEKDAIKLADMLQTKGYEVYITRVKIPAKGTWHRVRIGSYNTKNEANNFGSNLAEKEPLINSMFVTRRN